VAGCHTVLVRVVASRHEAAGTVIWVSSGLALVLREGCMVERRVTEGWLEFGTGCRNIKLQLAECRI
jgi:hypothetical protein